MIILGGLPSGIIFGPHGITPSQIATGGTASSPLLNDVDPGDETTELLWRLEPTYLAAGVTAVTDNGSYSLTGAPTGTHVQPYRLFALPATGAPYTGTSTITTTVSEPVVPPSIVAQPQPQSVTVGSAAAFAVTAAGTAPLAYQWRRNGAAISGATASSYVLSSPQLVDGGAVFDVTVSNAAGSVTSSGATLTVQAGSVAPAITAQPQAQTVSAGEAAAFAVTATGTAPLAYQWRRNGINISGATAASYLLPAAQAGDNGAQFSVQVSNAAGAVTSAAAVLTVQTTAGAAPVVVANPQNQTVVEGAPVTFQGSATGTAPLAYQWRRNGVNLPGATAATLSFTAALVDAGAAYSLVISNTFGSVQTSAALLSVLPSTAAPTITTQPQSQVLEDGATAVLSVVAVGAVPLAYQWRKDGAPLAGAVQPTLQVPNVNLLDNRTRYQVVVSNSFGQATSSAADLLVPVVSLAAAKLGARIDDARFDADIPRWVDAAVRLAEQFCNTYFTPKQPAFDRPDWPTAGSTFPVSGATGCRATYWDGAAWVALAPEAMVVFADGSRTGVAPASGTTWPALGEVVGGPRVRLVFSAGPSTAASLPVEVQHFVIAHVSLWADENRAAAPQAAQNFPWLYAGLEPLKVY